MLAFGGSVFEQGNFHFRTASNLEALTFVQTLFKEGCAWYPPAVNPGDEFAARRALFITGTLEDMAAQSRAFNTLASTDKWTVLPFPGEDGDALVVSGPSYILLPSTDAQQLAAWFFIRWILDRKSTRLNSSHIQKSRMPSSA